MKKINRKTILFRILVPLVIFVVFQAGLLYGIIRVNRIFPTLDNNAIGLLQKQTQNKEQQLLSSMIGEWSNLSVTETNVLAKTKQILEKNHKNWEDIKSDVELNNQIIEANADELITRLRYNKVTGIFMILDGEGVKDKPNSYAGFYVRDMDPITETLDGSDLSLVRGVPTLSRNRNISLNSFWKACFTFDQTEDEASKVFYKPMEAAAAYEKDDSRYYGYWSRSFKFQNESDISILTYSIPLRNEKGFVYGVLGIEINERYFQNSINSGQYKNDENLCYFLGITDQTGKAFERVFSSSSKYVGDKDLDTTSKRTGDNWIIDLNSERVQDKKLKGAVCKMKLYNDNTAFDQDEWVFLGIQDEDMMFAESQKFHTLILWAIILTLITGIILSLFISNGTVRPIINLVRNLKAVKPNGELQLPKTNITEIDALADAITDMNREVLDNAKRTSSLIELSGLPVGVYEIRKDADYVYCSNGFFKILGIEDKITANNMLRIEEAQEMIAAVKENMVDDNVYAFMVNGKTKYVCFFEQSSKNGEIGSIHDITSEIVEKKRLAYERDFDSLTGIWNRRAFEQFMDDKFVNSKELGIAAVIMFDLDNLKSLNDTYGHDCGDMYIKTFAQTLKIFETDNSKIARRSGDEFYVFMYGFDNKNSLYQTILQCWQKLKQEKMVLPDNNEYNIRVSAGISWYPEDAMNPAKLIHYADFAMYQAKQSQKGAILQFNKEDYGFDSVLFSGQEAFNRLLDNMLVKYMFQPIYSVKDAQVYGYELLIRSEVEEIRTPDVILKMAKFMGKLHYVEYMTWYKGLSDAKQLIADGVIGNDKKLFVNSIANQTLFVEEREKIKKCFADILPNVIIEVTEGENNNMEYTERKLNFIRELGGLISIDDYGTGYNSELALVAIPDEEYEHMAYKVALYHHEKWNGKGYPFGMKEQEIPLCARIMAVADVFDAVSAKRCYRDAMPLDTCYKIIREGKNEDFDPDVVDAFFERQQDVEEIYHTMEG